MTARCITLLHKRPRAIPGLRVLYELRWRHRLQCYSIRSPSLSPLVYFILSAFASLRLEVTINDVHVLRPDDNIWLSNSNLCVHGVRFFIATPIRAHFRARSGFNITIQDVADGRKPTGNELLPVWVVTGRLAPYRYAILKPLLDESMGLGAVTGTKVPTKNRSVWTTMILDRVTGAVNPQIQARSASEWVWLHASDTRTNPLACASCL